MPILRWKAVVAIKAMNVKHSSERGSINAMIGDTWVEKECVVQPHERTQARATLPAAIAIVTSLAKEMSNMVAICMVAYLRPGMIIVMIGPLLQLAVSLVVIE